MLQTRKYCVKRLFLLQSIHIRLLYGLFFTITSPDDSEFHDRHRKLLLMMVFYWAKDCFFWIKCSFGATYYLIFFLSLLMVLVANILLIIWTNKYNAISKDIIN